MQTALHRDIDMAAAGRPLAGAAEQAGIEYPLRRDQHQMVGFATVIFHWDPPRAALWPLRTEVTLAEIWALSRRDSAIIKRKKAAGCEGGGRDGNPRKNVVPAFAPTTTKPLVFA